MDHPATNEDCNETHMDVKKDFSLNASFEEDIRCLLGQEETMSVPSKTEASPLQLEVTITDDDEDTKLPAMISHAHDSHIKGRRQLQFEHEGGKNVFEGELIKGSVLQSKDTLWGTSVYP
jgi:hypothetical protein